MATSQESEYDMKIKSDGDGDDFEMNPSKTQRSFNSKDSAMSSDYTSGSNSHVNVGYDDSVADDDDDDDSSFTSDDEEDDVEGGKDDNHSIAPADFEDQAVQCFRYFVLFVLVASTAAAGAATYFFIHNDQQDDFTEDVSKIFTK
jgi:hypothetical protein